MAQQLQPPLTTARVQSQGLTMRRMPPTHSASALFPVTADGVGMRLASSIQLARYPSLPPRCLRAGCPTCRPGQAAYAMQLCLAALHRFVQPPAASGGDQTMVDADAAAAGSGASVDGLDAGAVVGAARAAPDGTTRNQALALLAVLARSHPKSALQHVMDVRGVRAELPAILVSVFCKSCTSHYAVK